MGPNSGEGRCAPVSPCMQPTRASPTYAARTPSRSLDELLEREVRRSEVGPRKSYVMLRVRIPPVDARHIASSGGDTWTIFDAGET